MAEAPSLRAEDRAVLSPTEQAAYDLASFWARHLKVASLAWNVAVISPAVWLSTGRRLSVRGLPHLRAIPLRDPLILVANHRSFFDFFLVTMLVRFMGGGLLRRFFFPVRSAFFYDTIPGVAVNLLASGMAMFPPIFRELSKSDLNRRCIATCIDELSQPRTVLGLHPEGTRNQSADPFELLPPKPGIGKLVLEATQARVLPVFIHGLGNDALAELGHNLFAPEEHPVNVLIGPELDFADLRSQGSRPRTQKRAAERCAAALGALAEDARGEALDRDKPRRS